MKKIGKNVLSVLSILAALGAFGQDVVFYASVDKNPVEIGEVFSLRLTLENGRGNIEPPNLSEFQVIFGPSQSSSYRIVNGAQSSNITLSYTMRATNAGTFTIGVAKAKVGNQVLSSEPITLKVVKGSGSATQSPQQTQRNQAQPQRSSTSANDNLKVQIVPSKTNVYQGEHIVLTYVLLSRYNNIDLGDTNFPPLSGFWSEDVNLGQTTWEPNYEMINGLPYRKAILKQQVIFPQRPGNLEIPPLKITSRVNRSFFNQGTEVSATSNSPSITVKALPGNAPESFEGAVGEYTFTVKSGTNAPKTNEAIDLTMTIAGSGNLTLVKNPAINFPADFDSYDPELKNRINVNSAGVSGSKTFQYLVIPRYPGKYEIPAVDFTYFDTKREKYITLSQGPFQYEVQGEPGIVGSGSDGVAKSRVEDIRKDIRYILTNLEDLMEEGSLFFRSPGYFGLLFLPFLSFLAFITVRKRRQAQERDVTGTRRKKANKMARKRLSEAEKAMKIGDTKIFYAEIFKALYGYLGDKLGVASASLAKPAIKTGLERNGADEPLIIETMALIETCEMARFAPTAEHSDEAFYRRTVSLIEKLEGVLK